ncbi:MAG TPA: GatB/YqeY domain-containing protein [Candidatus Polarisedimenticolia bacterium]|nr:GatB/YqeY domain-containing protein [Candidatus Polarisedimenticolia bacterium]
MSLKQRITDDLKAAMKSGDRDRLEALRMIKARILEAEVDQRAAKGREYELSDPEAIQVIAAYAKQRRDSIDSYRQAGREDLASKEEAELAMVREYLPAQLSADEVRRIVKEAIDASGASSPKDMGAVMKLVMPKVKGAADGKLVNQIVGELLAGK